MLWSGLFALGVFSEQMPACVLCHWIALGVCGKVLLVTYFEGSSLRSCWKLPLLPMEPMPAISQRDLPLAGHH